VLCERAERAERERETLRRENERLRQQVDHLQRQLDEARRAGYRQAAPFAKPLKKDPKRPGRKPGDAYGPTVAWCDLRSHGNDAAKEPGGVHAITAADERRSCVEMI